MRYGVTRVDILKCAGDLNANGMVRIKNKLTRLMERNHINLLIDLRDARHVDLAGLGILIERLKRIRAMNGDIKLYNLKPQVSETFRMVGVDNLIESYGSKEEALRSFETVCCGSHACSGSR